MFFSEKVGFRYTKREKMLILRRVKQEKEIKDISHYLRVLVMRDLRAAFPIEMQRMEVQK